MLWCYQNERNDWKHREKEIYTSITQVIVKVRLTPLRILIVTIKWKLKYIWLPKASKIPFSQSNFKPKPALLFPWKLKKTLENYVMSPLIMKLSICCFLTIFASSCQFCSWVLVHVNLSYECGFCLNRAFKYFKPQKLFLIPEIVSHWKAFSLFFLASASSDNMARLWNLEQGEVICEYSGHQKAVVALAFRDAHAV